MTASSGDRADRIVVDPGDRRAAGLEVIDAARERLDLSVFRCDEDFTRKCFRSTCDFMLVSSDAALVAALRSVFAADWTAHRTVGQAASLVG